MVNVCLLQYFTGGECWWREKEEKRQTEIRKRQGWSEERKEKEEKERRWGCGRGERQ